VRILGIDPGLQVTGYAILDIRAPRPALCEAGIIRSSEGRATTDLAPRLNVLYDSLVEVIEQYKPEAMTVEQLYAHYEHPRTAILMGHARGVILLAAASHDIPVFSYAATRIKKTITGHGHASKEQMQFAVQRELGLAKLPEPADVADAIAGALCHYHAQKKPAEIQP